MITTRNLRQSAAALLGVKLSQQQGEAFHWYATELLEWNQRFNLTAITDPQEIEIKHFLDSLTCLKLMGPRPVGRVIDVGTGAGFPGLPIKIACPDLGLTLVESVRKKVEFCKHVIRTLNLRKVQVVHARAEEAGRSSEHRQQYDWALARAVAAMPILVEYLLPFLRMGGQAIVQKGVTGPAEAQASEAALKLLGGQVDQVIPLELPKVVETRFLIAIRKCAATPEEYPRRAGVPSKRPLG